MAIPHYQQKKEPQRGLTKPAPEPKDLYSQAAQSHIERKIVQTTFFSTAIGRAENRNPLFNTLIEHITRWRKYLASTSIPTSKEIEDEANFLITFFPGVTIGEFEWMIELYIRRELPIVYQSWPNFNADFMAGVIHGFRAFTDRQGARLHQDVKQRQQQERERVAPEVHADGKRFVLEKVHEQFAQDILLVSMLNDAYTYLIRTGQLSEELEKSPEARVFADQKMVLLQASPYRRPTGGKTQTVKDLLGQVQVNEPKEEDMHLRFVREYAVRQFFSLHGLDEILERVVPEHFLE